MGGGVSRIRKTEPNKKEELAESGGGVSRIIRRSDQNQEEE